jgi:hypothetical protein
MAMPYTELPNLNLPIQCILAMAILGPTAKFNSYQYFRLYGTLVAELTFDSAGDEEEAIFVYFPDVSRVQPSLIVNGRLSLLLIV